MRKYYIALLPLIILILLEQGLFAEAKKYRIAAILPLSGQVASFGKYLKNGIDLAYEDLKPEYRDKIEIIYEDDQFDQMKTISAYRMLKNSKQVDAVFVLASPPANALGPITEADKTLLMAIGASDPTIAVNKNFSFIHWVTPPVLGEKLAEELIKRDLKRIAFLASEATGTIADIDATIEALKSRGKSENIVYRQTFLKETTDFRSALLQIRQKKIDAVVTVLFPGSLSSFAKQFREMKITAELIGMETFEDEAEVKASNGALLGAWYTSASDNSEAFVSSYYKKYGEHPGWAAGNAYDSVNLISAAVTEVGTNNEKVRDFLRSVKNYSGATGIYSSSGDNRFTLPAALKRVTANGFESIAGH